MSGCRHSIGVAFLLSLLAGLPAATPSAVADRRNPLRPSRPGTWSSVMSPQLSWSLRLSQLPASEAWPKLRSHGNSLV